MYSGYVVKIEKIREHPNADRLQIAEVFYTDVVIGLDFNEGDKVIYFPADGVLNKEFCKDNLLLREDEGYIHENRRIKAISLRGVRSDGLILPIDVLSKYTDVNKLKIGEKINVLNGTEICKKYVPGGKKKKKSIQGSKKRKTRVKYPFFAQHVDTHQLRYNLNNFKPGDEIIITEKAHCTSQRSSNTIKQINRSNWLSRLFRIHLEPKKEYEYIMGSRRVNIPLNKIDDKRGFHKGNNFRLKAHNKFDGKLHKMEEVFYELCGFDDNNASIMPVVSNEKLKDDEFIKKYGKRTHFRYGIESGVDVFVYRMIMTNPDGYVVEYPWDMVKYRCSQMGVKHVPELERFYFTTTDDLIERVDKYIGGPSTIDPTHIREGVVVRVNSSPHFKVYKDKNFEFKVLEGIIKDESDIPDREEAEDFKMEE